MPAQTSMETTFNFHGSQAELPDIFTDTAILVPRTWPDADKLLMPPSTLDKSAALGCILVASDQRHEGPAEVKTGDDGTISVREQVSVRVGFYDRKEWQLGRWNVRFCEDVGDLCARAWRDDGPLGAELAHWQPGDIWVSLTPWKSSIKEIEVHLDLSDAELVRAERMPTTFTDSAHASWKIEAPAQDYLFWMLIRPDQQVAAPLFLQGTAAAPIFGWMSWFCLLLMLAGVLIFGWRKGLRAKKGAKTALIDLAILWSIMTLVILARLWSDVEWAFRRTGPDELAYRIEHAGFGLAATILAWRFLCRTDPNKGTPSDGEPLKTRMAKLAKLMRVNRVRLLVALLVLVATAATFPLPSPTDANGYLSESALPDSTFALQAWRTYLHAAIVAGIAAVIFASCLIAIRQLGWPVRRRRWVVVVSLGLILILIAQSVRWAIEDSNLARFDPDGPLPATTAVEWVFSSLAWLPDYFMALAPLAIFYAMTAVCVLLLRTLRWERGDADVEPGTAELLLAAIVFSALAVGVYGSYRGVGVALAFLVTLLGTWWVVLPGTKRARQHLLEIGGDTAIRDRKRARKRLLGIPAEAQTPKVREHLLTLGPRVTAWGNGVYGALVASVLAVPIVFYDLIALGRDGFYPSYWTSATGLFDFVQWLLFEVLHWVILGFALGYLWRVIPFRRGIYKALVLSAPMIGGLLADAVLSAVLDQAPWPPSIEQWGVMVTVLVVVGVVLDLASVRNAEAEGWDVVSILRLRNNRWLAAYGLVAAAIIFNVVKVIESGEPITSLPGAFLSSVLR